MSYHKRLSVQDRTFFSRGTEPSKPIFAWNIFWQCPKNCCANLQIFPTYVVLIHQRHRQTDRQTDNMQSQYRTLHYSASRRNKNVDRINFGFHHVLSVSLAVMIFCDQFRGLNTINDKRTTSCNCWSHARSSFRRLTCLCVRTHRVTVHETFVAFESVWWPDEHTQQNQHQQRWHRLLHSLRRNTAHIYNH